MDVFEAIFSRRSIRKFKKKPVEDELIWKILEAGKWAPSAGNMQSWEVILVKNDDIKEKLVAAAYLRTFIGEAPLIMVLCANTHVAAAMYNERGTELYCIQETACAAENMLLAVHALGLGACWVGSFDEEVLRRALDLPDYLKPVTIIPVGYPDENPYPPPRRDIEEIVHQDKFQEI